VMRHILRKGLRKTAVAVGSGEVKLVGRIAVSTSADLPHGESKLVGNTGWGRPLGRESDPRNVSEESLVNAPRMGPHCGTESIKPAFLHATPSLSFGRMHCTLSGFHAHGRNNAHISRLPQDPMSHGEDEESRKTAGTW
jgi:hypothetical protein